MQDPLEFYGFLMPKVEALNMDASFLSRNVNEGFSGGEKKRNEILQLAVLEAEVSILDEIDSGARRKLCVLVLHGCAGCGCPDVDIFKLAMQGWTLMRSETWQRL